jgi:hypothetical protein
LHYKSIDVHQNIIIIIIIIITIIIIFINTHRRFRILKKMLHQNFIIITIIIIIIITIKLKLTLWLTAPRGTTPVN